MKKLVGVLLTLAVAVSLMVMPAVTSASPGIGLNAVGSATAEISTAAAYSPTHSVKLYVKNGSVDWAEVSIPVNIALKDINELSFREAIQYYSPNGWKVQVVLGVDLNSNGVFDANLPAWHFTGDPSAKTAALAGDSFVSLEQPVGGDPGTGSWVLVNSLNECACWEPTWTVPYLPFADFLAALPGSSGITNDSVVREVILEIGGSGNWMDETAYVDDVTINGKTYDFEPTSSVGLTAYVPDIVAISVDPTVIDFGTLLPGKTSDVFDITVTNIGTHKVNVGASLDASSANLFKSNLAMRFDASGGGSTGPWDTIISDLAMDGSTYVQTWLPVPSDYTPIGSESGTLIFTATAV